MYNNNKKQYGKFLGVTLRAFKNNYAKPGSYEYKIKDAKKYFLEDVNKFLNSNEVRDELAKGRPLSIGFRTTTDDRNINAPVEKMEMTLYVGQMPQPRQQYQPQQTQQKESYEPSIADKDMDDDIPF